MKRIISIIIAVLTMLTAFVPAFADGGGPVYVSFEAVVTDRLGAAVYDPNWDFGSNAVMVITGERVPYDAVCEITGEYSVGGEQYYYVVYEEKEIYGYVKESDVKNVSDSVSYTKDDKLDQPINIMVLEDTYLRKGYSKMFDTVGNVIKAGTKLTINYMVGDLYFTSWGYVSYNGTEGWIDLRTNEEDCPVAFSVSDKNNIPSEIYVVEDEVKLTLNPEYDESEKENAFVSGTIPKGTKLTPKFYKRDYFRFYFYTEYEGIKGWLTYADDIFGDEKWDNKIAIKRTEEFVVMAKNIPVYEECGNESSNVLGVVKKNTIIQTYFTYANRRFLNGDPVDGYVDWYAVKINGKQGWIPVEDYGTELFYAYNVPKLRVTKSTAIIYENGDLNSRQKGVIPIGKEVLSFASDDTYRFVDYNGIRGWVNYKAFEDYDYDIHWKVSYDEYFDGKYTPEYLYELRTGEKPMTDIATEPETTVEKETEVESVQTTQAETTEETVTEKAEEAKSASMTPVQITFSCIAGALILAATAAVSIVFIKKKKAE